MPLLFIGLTLVSILSPLCTIAYLWQMKEWRLDRLIVHLEREGYGRQVFGMVRPAIVALYAVALILVLQSTKPLLLLGALGLLALLTMMQFLLRRQRLPVWTQKARILVMTTFVLLLLLSFILAYSSLYVALPLLPLGTPLIFFFSWLLFLPLDLALKHRILRQAKEIRERNPHLIVIGVTGSVGKTTTKELLACALKDLQPLVTPAYMNTELGVAQWMVRKLPAFIANRGDAPAVMVVEMGAYKKGEIALMSTYVKQTIGVVTYIGTQHLALFGSQENLLHAKAEILTALPATGHAFLNAHSPFIGKLRTFCPCPSTIVGTDSTAEIKAEHVTETADGIAFLLQGTHYEIPLPGTHNVTNALLAISVARHLGVSPEAIKRNLQSFKTPERTFSTRMDRSVRVLDDTHNSSPTSMKAAFDWAKAREERPRTLLASGFIELGDTEEAQSERELGAAAKEIFDRVIIIDPQSAAHFSEGFGKEVETLQKSTQRVPRNSLLVCVGRMPAATVNRLLPAPR